jgi:hypothetical protein
MDLSRVTAKRPLSLWNAFIAGRVRLPRAMCLLSLRSSTAVPASVFAALF